MVQSTITVRLVAPLEVGADCPVLAVDVLWNIRSFIILILGIGEDKVWWCL